MIVHIFNPETDFALGDGRPHYTPPVSVVKLRRSMALFPAVYAKPGDAVLTLDALDDGEVDDSPYRGIFHTKNLTLLSLDNVGNLMKDIEGFSPWGWNLSLKRVLLEAGVSPLMLPSDEDLLALRELSHRRSTILFHNSARSISHRQFTPLPIELQTEDDVASFWKNNPDCWMKAPWSSSGRGILHTDGLEERHVRQWARGIIRRQGSVMAEINRGNSIDFATEWLVEPGNIAFSGLSVFATSSRGKYHGNVNKPQKELRELIESHTDDDLSDIINMQREVIAEITAGKYSGPLGIDMLVDGYGHINPCVEMNFRMTMGIATILDTTSKKISVI